MSGVALVGCGARTPLGTGVLASAAGVRAGLSAVRVHPAPIDAAGEQMAYAADARLDRWLPIGERLARLAASALREALAPVADAVRPWDSAIPAFVGLPALKPGLPDGVAASVATAIDAARVPGVRVAPVAVLPYGHAAGLMALEQAWHAVASGASELCLAGGIDSYLAPATLEWLDAEGQLQSARRRSGFPPGEGAGFCLLADAAFARRHGLAAAAHVVGAATTMEPCPMKTETVCVGLGLTGAIVGATRALKLPAQRVGRIYCDLNGERYRNEEFTYAVLRTQRTFVDANDYVHPADAWGDVGAATGPLLAGLAVASALRGYANGPRALLWAGSEDGRRSAALLELSLQEGQT